MAVERSQLNSKLWQWRDEPRGGMDASQYKGYVLTLLLAEAGSARAMLAGGGGLVYWLLSSSR